MEIVSKVVYALETGQDDLCLETARKGGPDVGRATVRHLLERVTSDGDCPMKENNLILPSGGSLVLKLLDLNVASIQDVLFEACRSGDVYIAKRIIQMNPQALEIRDTYCYHFTALHWACQCGSAEICNLILNMKPKSFDINAKETKFGSTALHMAYYTGNEEIYSALIKAGANVDVCNKFGETSLHLAAKAGYHKCCKILIDAKADVNATQRMGNTPLHWATLYKLKISGEESISDVHQVCEVLLAGGAEIDATNRDDATPLHLAAKKGNLAACVSLIAAKADVNKFDKSYTPLHYAAFNGHVKICEVLLEAGADPTIIEDKLGCALHFAAYKGNARVCKLLTEYCFTIIELKNKSGKTALDLAQEAGFPEVVEMLKAVKQAKKQRNGSISY